jgi:hypothetical protein
LVLEILEELFDEVRTIVNADDSKANRMFSSPESRDKVIIQAFETYMRLYNRSTVQNFLIIPLDNDHWPKSTWGMRLGQSFQGIKSEGRNKSHIQREKTSHKAVKHKKWPTKACARQKSDKLHNQNQRPWCRLGQRQSRRQPGSAGSDNDYIMVWPCAGGLVFHPAVLPPSRLGSNTLRSEARCSAISQLLSIEP